METFTCRERPCDRGAAEERDELAAFHHEEFPTSSEYSWMKNGRFAGGKLDPTASEAPRFKSRNILRTLATPEPIKDWSLTSLKEKLIKIGAKVVSHGRYVVFKWRRSPSHDKCSRRYCG